MYMTNVHVRVDVRGFYAYVLNVIAMRAEDTSSSVLSEKGSDREQRCIGRGPKEKRESKNIQQAGFPDGHPL